ncbi:hypothetical protein CEE37_02400 [candidate division LCP-89 bacterium B3_LCP]|uniref:Right handed beta helix domain-containing protein n=1 Tax=candidate division LCP-89 bacterium B3_LCP TaxID=2012998 RepID=A0A532V5U9_UNCL8|nr:MAG: hypothetical protein CEE37_02400 [candidate division LCP-89 bacterium B3_LCP]
MKHAKTAITIVLSFMLSAGLAFAQTPLSGSLSGTIGPDVFLVEGDCDILQGETLTIAPGTTFLFSGHYYWKIYGTLIAQGTETDSIVFTRQNPTQGHRWGGLRFMSGAPAGSIIEYCLIDNCMNYEWLNNQGGGIYSDGVSFNVSHTTIQYCEASDGGGFYSVNGAQVVFDQCSILHNTASSGGGLYYSTTSRGEIRNSVIMWNTSTGT